MFQCLAKRCSAFAITTGLKCRLKTRKRYNCKAVCHIHADILFTNSVLYIQKVYIGYRTRQKLKRIFVRLPQDAQRLVIGYMREPFYIKRQHAAIAKILDRKATKMIDLNYVHEDYNYDYFYNMIKIYQLYAKYIAITTKSSTDHLYYVQNNTVNIFTVYINYHGQFNDRYNYDRIKQQLFRALTAYKLIYEAYFDVPPRKRTYLILNA